MAALKSAIGIAGLMLCAALVSAPAIGTDNPSAPNLDQQVESLGVVDGSAQPFAFKFGTEPASPGLAPPFCFIDETITYGIQAILDRLDPLGLGYGQWGWDELKAELVPLDPCVWKSAHYQGMVRGNRADGTPIFILSRNGNAKDWSYEDTTLKFNMEDICRNFLPCILWNILTGKCLVHSCDPLAAIPDFDRDISLCLLFDYLGKVDNYEFSCVHTTPGDLLVVEMPFRPQDGESIGETFYEGDKTTGQQRLNAGHIQYTHPGGGQLIEFKSGDGGLDRQVAFFGTNGWCAPDQNGHCSGDAGPTDPETAVVVLAMDPAATGIDGSELRSITSYCPGSRTGCYGEESACPDGEAEWICPDGSNACRLPSLQNMAVMRAGEEGEKILFVDAYGGEANFYELASADLANLIEYDSPTPLLRVGKWFRSALPNEDDFPKKPQSVTLAQEPDGTIHLLTMHNDARGTPPLGADKDNMASYQGRVDAIVSLFKIATEWPDDTQKNQCGEWEFDLAPAATAVADHGAWDRGGESYMGDFVAGATAYVSPTGRLFVYSAEHYPWGPPSKGGYCEADCRYVRMGELSSTSPVLYGPREFVAREGTLETVDLGEFSIGGEPAGRSWTAVVDLGEGTIVTMAHPVPGPLSVRHTYLDGPDALTTSIKVQETGAYYGDRTFELTVENVPPTVAVDSISQTNGKFLLPLAQTAFAGSFTDPAWVDTHIGSWDFGDGSVAAGHLVEENDEPDSTGIVTGTHTYSAPGDYTAGLTVTDDDGGAGTDSAAIQILTAEEAAQEINDFIQNLPDDSFKNNARQRKNAFASKFRALTGQIEGGRYQEAIAKLANDIRPKADGHVDGGLGNDWIIDPEAQVEICAMADAVIAYLETML